MTVRLEAWLEGRHVGQFIDDDGTVRFEYDIDAPGTPISLSLPRDRPATKRAAANVLDNLVPDERHTRERLAAVYGAPSASTFDLLAVAGGDVAGALVLLPEGAAPLAGPPLLNPALSRDVADRINSIKVDPDAWVPRETPAWFSLAGTQGKFALASVDGDWYWSNSTAPSTHILKPGRPSLRNIEAAEVAALTLARRAGVTASPAEVLLVEDQTAFLTARFDRERESGEIIARRLHAEDLAQSLGIGPAHKYSVTARQAATRLAEVDVDGGLVRSFLGQLAFNTLIGNADAHAKNYSVLLRPDGVSLAPLYDAVPVGLYPEFDQALAMSVGGARFPQAATLDHWRKLARVLAVDEDELSDLVGTIATRVLEHNETAWDSLDDDQATRLRTLVGRNATLLVESERP